MTHPDGSPYSPAQRRAIIAEAKATAAELLRKLELLADLDGSDDPIGHWNEVTGGA